MVETRSVMEGYRMVASDCSRKLRLHVTDYAVSRRGCSLVCTNRHGPEDYLTVPDARRGKTLLYDVLVPAFEQETGIEVELILMSWAGFIDQFVALHAAGQAPDVAQLGGADLGTFVLNGLIRPLNEWTDGWDGLSDFSPAAVADGMVDGKLYSIAYRLTSGP